MTGAAVGATIAPMVPGENSHPDFAEQAGDFILRTSGAITIARLTGDHLVGVLEVQRVADGLHRLIADGCVNMVLDLKLVRFAGSAMLGMLISLQKDLINRGGRLVLSHTEHIAPLLDLTKSRKLFRIATDPKSALLMFGD